eukprot:329061-Chlamydomonas_euryale.AAC.1
MLGGKAKRAGEAASWLARLIVGWRGEKAGRGGGMQLQWDIGGGKGGGMQLQWDIEASSTPTASSHHRQRREQRAQGAWGRS